MALALACAAVFLYERSKVALIIDDEAARDLRDAISCSCGSLSEVIGKLEHIKGECPEPICSAPSSTMVL